MAKAKKGKAEKNGSSVKREYDSQMALKIGTGHYDKAMDKLDSAEESTAKDIFTENINSVKVGQTTGGGYYNPNNNTINYSVRATENPRDDGMAEQQTFFHESAHALDRKAGEGKASFSAEYNDGELAKTLKAEYKANTVAFKEQVTEAWENHDYDKLKDLGAISSKGYDMLKDGSATQETMKAIYDSASNEYRYAVSLKNKYSADSRACISDMMDSASRGNYHLGWGHGSTYWNSETIACEAHANIMAASITSPSQLQAIKEVYPKTYEVWQKMVKAQNEKLRQLGGAK